jgi:hypothetical protein
MPVVDESIIVNRPRSEVFAFGVDPEKVLLYSSNLIEYEQVTDGPVGLGARNRGSVRVAGRRIDFLDEVVEFKDGEAVAYRSIESPLSFELRVTYEDSDGGTMVSWRQETQGFKGFFGKLTDPLVTRMYAKDVRSNLEKFKDLLEAD